MDQVHFPQPQCSDHQVHVLLSWHLSSTLPKSACLLPVFFSCLTWLDGTDAKKVHTAEDVFGEVRENDISNLLEASGIVLYEACE